MLHTATQRSRETLKRGRGGWGDGAAQTAWKRDWVRKRAGTVWKDKQAGDEISRHRETPEHDGKGKKNDRYYTYRD